MADVKDSKKLNNDLSGAIGFVALMNSRSTTLLPPVDAGRGPSKAVRTALKGRLEWKESSMPYHPEGKSGTNGGRPSSRGQSGGPTVRCSQGQAGPANELAAAKQSGSTKKCKYLSLPVIASLNLSTITTR